MKRVRRTFEWQGKRYYAEGSTPEEAERNRERMKLELQYGLRSTGGMTVAQLAELYMKTLENSRRNLTEKTIKQKQSLVDRIILPAFGSMPVRDVTQIHVLLFLNEQAEKYTSKHVDKIFNLLNGIFRLGVASHQCIINPCDNLEKPQGATERVRREATSLERELYLGHLIWLDMVILCGLRPGETANIRFCDIGEGWMYVDGTKNKNAKRYVPLPKWLHDRILDQPHTFDSEFVCQMRDNKRSRQWIRLKSELQLPDSDLEPYCFRHSYVTDLENCPGFSQAAIKKTVGHSLEGVTDRYTHSRKETCIQMLPHLEEYWRTQGIFSEISVTFVTETAENGGKRRKMIKRKQA